jgi:uncharacterized protein (TIGR03032 family)
MSAPSPFSLTHSPQIPELLAKMKCSIAITTYQAGKLVLISPKDENFLSQLPRTLDKPMGIASTDDGEKIAIATKDEIIVFKNSSDLAKFYPKGPGKYDAMYFPRVTFHTCALDIHDLAFGKDGELYGVNTLFSCISKFTDEYNFEVYWKPDFISKITSEDRCHLNGMCMEGGKPRYASAFNQGDTPQSWREKVTETGVIIDIENNEILSQGLSMPHSPRLYQERLFVLESGKGHLTEIDRASGEKLQSIKVGGFVRGISFCDDHAFIATSKLRKNSSTFAHLNIPDSENVCSIRVYHIPTMSFVGYLKYETSVDEIFDLHILKGYVRPNILNTINDIHKKGVSIQDATFWAKSE